MGLERPDVDFTKGVIHVRQASQYLPGEGSFTKAPKNEMSIRTISMPESLVPVLKRYKAWQSEKRLKLGDAWQKSERVFTTWDGRAGHPEWPSQWFPKFIKKHNLAPIPFHGLRHTSATLLIAEGADLKEVSDRLGHANTSTTGNIYAHFLKSADKAAADKLDSAIARARSQKKCEVTHKLFMQ
jgi:integrase